MPAYLVSTGYTPLSVIIQAMEISSQIFYYIDKLRQEYGDHHRILPENHILGTGKLFILKVINLSLFT